MKQSTENKQSKFVKPKYPFGMSAEEWVEYKKLIDEVRQEYGSVRNGVLQKIEEYKKKHGLI
jgi:hypothetical protein